MTSSLPRKCSTTELQQQVQIPVSEYLNERVKGIEPSPPAWKAGALPLSYTRFVLNNGLPLSRMTGQCNKFATLTNGQTNNFDFKTKIPSQKNPNPLCEFCDNHLFPHIEPTGKSQSPRTRGAILTQNHLEFAPEESQARPKKQKVGGAGFEPAKAEPTDLQSVPFDRFGTPPFFDQL